MPRSILHSFFALILLGLPAVLAPVLAATPAADPQPATLVVLNVEIVTFRAKIGGATPELRVQRARERLAGLAPAEIDGALRTLPVQLGDARGVQVMLESRLLFGLFEGDVDVEARQDLDSLVAQALARLEEARRIYHLSRDRPTLLNGLLRVAIATVVLAAAAWLIRRLERLLAGGLERWRSSLAARQATAIRGEVLARLLGRTLFLVGWLLFFGLAYAWLRFALASFPLTEPLSHSLGQWLADLGLWIGAGVLHGLPGIVTVLVVFVLTRAVVDALGYAFDNVQGGRLRVPFLYPDTIGATRRIVTMMVWGLGVAIAYPYVPGSSSDAFKGLSVLFGLMLTLGSTGVMTQAMSGLMVVYSRALKKGDYVRIDSVEGVVTEVGALATKILDIRNEEITVPHAVVVSSSVRNYSKLAGERGSLISTRVTIGYDAPWRQVHAMLIESAGRTEGIRADPRPYVYQRALQDFYVEYELFAHIDEPLRRVAILSALHEHIQDAFNEHGVQIMSPHFFAQPDQPVTVAPDKWYAPPARPPAP